MDQGCTLKKFTPPLYILMRFIATYVPTPNRDTHQTLLCV